MRERKGRIRKSERCLVSVSNGGEVRSVNIGEPSCGTPGEWRHAFLVSVKQGWVRYDLDAHSEEEATWCNSFMVNALSVDQSHQSWSDRDPDPRGG